MAQGSSEALVKTETPGDDILAIVTVPSPAYIQAYTPVPITVARTANTNHPPAAQISTEQTLMPVTIKQIKDAFASVDSPLMVINNTATPTVKLIGKVKGKMVDEYKGTFAVDDGTGLLPASLWFTYSASELDCVQEGAYAMVVGRVKLTTVGPELQCIVCRPVTNFNDIPHHFLSVIATHIDLVMRPEKTIYMRVAELWREDNAKNIDQPTRGVASFARKMATAQASLLYLGPGSNKPEPSLSDVKGKAVATAPSHDAIMRVLRDAAHSNGPNGVHVDSICEALSTDPVSIFSSMQELALAGELYTTIDDKHYAPT